ncbi:patatin-like phospholipase family protein [Clostridium aminobutyricum]|uniref:Patatin-like phospholipase family protein n=1 Tax=Clostridium aminobutyricum TaxID=33953 RepID=A0A939D9E2_CLOAM|nr:patatin-like phospholipase family protein [Clostridium aminobutyricum]MBN7773183.1 patatin-like phospholipase family protein [Clostridium aminobutyricum]
MEEGKTALVLGGGGSRGAYEIGVWQALNELGIEIDMVTGASIGAVNGAMIAQGSFEEALALWHDMRESTITKLEEEGVLKQLLEEKLREQDVRNSPIEYGTVAVELPNLTPHRVFIEDIPIGKLNDYILASAACFPIINPHEIDDKKFIDGGYLDIMPVKMVLEKGAKNVIAVNLDAFGYIDQEAFNAAPFLKVISSAWDLGAFTVFHPKNIRRIIRLGYLDTMKAFDVFAGIKYTFIKGEFAKRGLKEAEAVAEIFELDPSLIYSQKMLNKRLKKALTLYEESSAKRKPTFDKELFKATLNALDTILSKKTISLFIAQKLNESDFSQESPSSLIDGHFLSKKAAKLFSKELLAASYIAKYLQ